MNPCPCGWLGHASGRCRCSPSRVDAYRARISGPLVDRIDMTIDVPALPASEIAVHAPAGETTSATCARASRPRALANASGRA
jgi:magnesium chelatase family protein